MKRIISILIAVCMFLAVTAGLAEDKPTISFSEEEYSVSAGKTITLKTVITPKKNMKLEWSSSDESIATVTNKGAVKGIAEGTTEITVKAAGDETITATCKVSVVVPVKKMAFTDKNIELPTGFTWKLEVSIDPQNATNKAITFASSNEKIATVDESGLVTAVGKGSAKITATAQDGSKAKAVINVKVNEYDIVFTDQNLIEKTLYTNVYGGERIKYKTKNKVVNIEFWGIGTSMSSSGLSYMTTYRITPLKAGTDTLTFTIGSKKLTLSVFVSPDVFASKETKKDESSSIEPNESNLSHDLTFWDIPWGTSYEETSKLIANKSYDGLSELKESEDSLFTATTQVQIGNFHTSYAGFSFKHDDNMIQKTCLSQIRFSILLSLVEYDLPDLKELMKKEYGDPVLDELTGLWDTFHWNVGKKCIWEKGDRRITIITEQYHYVSIIYSNLEAEE